MKFSIIIPTYNRAWCIERAIISILKQIFSDWEIIIVDDGSTDNTKKVLEKYLNKYKNIKYFYKENGGVGSARNLGIKKAQGDYLIFLDSDDELTKNALNFINKSIIKYQNFRVFFFGTVELNGKKMYYLSNKIEKVGIVDLIRGKKVYGEFLPCVRKNVFDKYKFFENINGGEGLLWYKIAKKELLIYIKKDLRLYHVDANNSLVRRVLTEKDIKNIIEINKLIIKKFGAEYKKYNINELGNIYFVMARMKALLNKKSWRYFKLGIKYRGCNFKNICLYIIAILDYRCLFTNCLLRVNLFINNLKY